MPRLVPLSARTVSLPSSYGFSRIAASCGNPPDPSQPSSGPPACLAGNGCMAFSAKPTSLEDIAVWRDLHLLEMGCQVVHDSIHDRRGWTQEYMLFVGDILTTGYDAVVYSATPFRTGPPDSR